MVTGVPRKWNGSSDGDARPGELVIVSGPKIVSVMAGSATESPMVTTTLIKVDLSLTNRKRARYRNTPSRGAMTSRQMSAAL